MASEFLKKIFEEEINSEGNVKIIDLDFERSQILRELEPTSYEVAFDDWNDERRKRLSEKGSDIIKQYDNATRFEKLKKSYKANSVTPFVGAGMSMSSKYSGWTSFLIKIRQESDVEESTLSNLLTEGKYEEAAQILYDDLGAELFNEHVENEFSSSKEIKGAVCFLPDYFENSSVITTNFDNILECLYVDDKKFDFIRTGKQLNEIIRQLLDGNKILIKIHGDCKQVADRVLTLNEYESTYNEKSVLDSFFNRIIYRGALLFLGCSLSNDRTFQLIKEITHREGAHTLPRHYAFLEEIRDDRLRVKRKKELARANIFPIWYPEGEHDESIEALFIKLQEN